MNRETLPSVPPAADSSDYEQSERLVHFRLGAAWMGGMLVVCGVALLLGIFFTVWQFVREPRELKSYVDHWEEVAKGNQNVAQTTLERRGPSDQNGGANDAVEQQDRSEQLLARTAAQVMAFSSRPLAIGILLFLAALLVRIAVAVAEAGTRLMGLSVSEQGLLKRLVEEIRRQK